MSAGALEPRTALARLLEGGGLSRGEMETLIGSLMDGAIEPAMQAALLVALAAKGESIEEVTGAAEAMRRRVVPVPHSRSGLVDTCGTGGDGRGTFNISTAAAFVAAAAGVPVAKHGNRSVSSRSGSADVLASLGVAVDVPAEVAAAALDRIGLAFLFAPRLHPAMREVMPVRRALGVRTLFNLLGPLTNPAGASRQVLGVYSAERVEVVAGALAMLGSEHSLVVHGADGLDEITSSGPTTVAEVRGSRVRVFELTPEDFGVQRGTVEDLAGGEPAHNARLMRSVLEGKAGPLRDVTLINAAAALVVGALADDWREGMEKAAAAIDDGGAMRKLEQLRTFDAG